MDSGDCGETPTETQCTDFCVCGVAQATGDSLTQCKTEAVPSADTSGWCYVAAAQGAAEATLVADCPPDNPQRLRFFGNAIAPADGINVLACSSFTAEPTPRPNPQLPRSASPASVVTNSIPRSPATVRRGQRRRSRGKLRVRGMPDESLPGSCQLSYGQDAGAGACRVPGTNEAVAVQVSPQLVKRQASLAATCSCRCAGGGPGPYCTCPESMQCDHLVDALKPAG